MLVTVPTAALVAVPTTALITLPTAVVAVPTPVVALPTVALTLAVTGVFTAMSRGLVPAAGSDACADEFPDPDCRDPAHEGFPDP